DDLYPVVPREPSCCMAVEALIRAKKSLGTDLNDEISGAFERYIDWIANHAVTNGEGDCFWLPNFGEPTSDSFEQMMATVWVCRSLFLLKSEGLEDLDRISHLLNGGI